LHVGDRDGVPMFTITCSSKLGAPGVTPTWTVSQLVDLCHGGTV